MTRSLPLRHPPSDLIDGSWIGLPGNSVVSHNPADPGDIVWQASPNLGHVNLAISAARNALGVWAWSEPARRYEYLRRWQRLVSDRAEDAARLMTREVGKSLAESRAEVASVIAKVDITLDPAGTIQRIAPFDVNPTGSKTGRCRFKPHGVMAVIGPFNFPAHLPTGHIVPALAAGNTVVFKPSEKAPAIGQWLAESWVDAGLPDGVLNVVHGGGDVAAALCNHDDLDGILFTGSLAVGRRIMEANLDRPGRMLALEMGGNNAAVVMHDADLRLAVIENARAAFVTSGQRCTCTRRIIVHEAVADRFVAALVRTAGALSIGPPDADPPVFLGPLISEASVEAVLAFQRRAIDAGGRAHLEAHRVPNLLGHFVSPGVIGVDDFPLESDDEVFGPMVRVTPCADLDEAIDLANATRFGLAASIFTRDSRSAEAFFREVRAGCINWNTGTAGASSRLPFGGLGHSGNHRPAGAFSIDYSAYPVAAMTETGTGSVMQPPPGMSFDDSWLA